MAPPCSVGWILSDWRGMGWVTSLSESKKRHGAEFCRITSTMPVSLRHDGGEIHTQGRLPMALTMRRTAGACADGSVFATSFAPRLMSTRSGCVLATRLSILADHVVVKELVSARTS